MKKTLTIIAVSGALALCGCSSISGTRTISQQVPGTTNTVAVSFTVKANSFLQKRQGVKFNAKDQQGLDVGFSEETVAGDVQMVQAMEHLISTLATTLGSGVATGGIAPAAGAATNLLTPAAAPTARTLRITP